MKHLVIGCMESGGRGVKGKIRCEPKMKKGGLWYQIIEIMPTGVDSCGR